MKLHWRPLDYPLLRAYYRVCGLYEYEINAKVNDARRANAPAEAIFARYNLQGQVVSWATPADLDLETRRAVLEEARYRYALKRKEMSKWQNA